MRSDYVHGYISRNVKSHKFEYLQSKSSSLRMIVIVDFGSEVQILPCLCMCREHIFKNTGKCYKPIQTMIWAGAATTVGGINIGVGVTNFCALRSASCWTTEEGRRSPGCLRVMSSHLSIYVQWKPDCCTSPDNLSYISSCCLRWAPTVISSRYPRFKLDFNEDSMGWMVLLKVPLSLLSWSSFSFYLLRYQ